MFFSVVAKDRKVKKIADVIKYSKLLKLAQQFGEVDKFSYGGGHFKSTANSFKFATGMWYRKTAPWKIITVLRGRIDWLRHLPCYIWV